MSSPTLVIDSRHCGPPRSGNGGWVAGALVDLASQSGWPTTDVTAEVRLMAPPPLNTPLALSTYDEGVALTLAGQTIATARLLPPTTEPTPVASVDLATAVAASAHYPGHRHHPFPTCFSCGTGRSDGLRIFPGPVPRTDLVAAPWTPKETDLPTLWAALDCIGAWAGDLTERALVLGQIRVRLLGTAVTAEPHVVVGQSRGQDGRKTLTASSLYGPSGALIGVAEHIWIAIDPTQFNALANDTKEAR